MPEPAAPLPADLFPDWTGVVVLHLGSSPDTAPATQAVSGAPAITVLHVSETDIPAIESLEARISNGAVRHLAADLRGAEMINTARLGLLMRLRKSITPAGGEIVVIHTSENIGDVLAITHLDRLLRVVRC